MRNITLTFDDGTTHQYNGVPDEVTPEQVQARAQKEFSGKAITNIDGGNAPHAKSSGGYEFSLSNVPGNLRDLAGGLVRGASSIGSTIIAPYDMAKDAINGKGLSLESNRERRKKVEDGLARMGVDTDGGFYHLGKLGAEIAGTAGAGGIIGNAVEKVAPALGEAIASGGFSLGKAPATTVGGKVANAATRVAGGAVNGGATVALANPDDVGVGAVIGGAFPVAAKVAGEAGNLISSAVRPLYESGRDAILGERLLEQAGAHPAQVIQNLKNAHGNTPGFNPTVGQASGSDELATFERVARGANPGAFQDTMEGQTRALVDAVRQHGGDDVSRQSLVDARTQATQGLYDAALKENVELTPELLELLQRPSMQEALRRAQNISNERGGSIIRNGSTDTLINEVVPGTISARGAQNVKMGLDDLINSGPQQGIAGNELRSIQNTRGEFVGELEKQLPEYTEANRLYAEATKPINQMDLGNAISDKLVPASQRDMDVPLNLNYEQFAKAIRDNGDGLAQKATGYKGSTLENTASPSQIDDYFNALNDIEYIKQGMRGKMAGSDTFQNLLFDAKTKNGILTQIPFLKGVSAASLMRVRDFIYKQPNEALQQKLLTVLQDPKGAAMLMESAQKGSATSDLVRMLKSPAIANSTELMLAQ